jgi:hypothetical protein
LSREKERTDNAFGEIIESWMAGHLNTCMPGQIVSFDRSTGTAEIQPCFMRKYESQDEAVSLPVIQDVPVFLFGSGDRWTTVDLVENSYVILFFSQRSVAKWLQSGGISDPELSRKFALSDAIALAGVKPLSEALVPGIEEGAIGFRSGDNSSNIKIDSAGDVQVTGKNATTVNGGGGTAVEFARLKAEFDILKSEYDNFVAVYNAHTQAVTGSVAAAPNLPIFPLTKPAASQANIDNAESDTVEIP